MLFLGVGSLRKAAQLLGIGSLNVL